MQVELDDVSSGERWLWQVGEEEFVDDACTRDANGALLFGSLMGGNDHTAQHTLRSHRNIWAVIQAAHHLAFGTLLELVGRQVQTCLDQRMIEDAVLFATGHKREPGQISEHGSGSILAVEPQQSVCLWKLIGRQIPT